jgi:hypothetical protein
MSFWRVISEAQSLRTEFLRTTGLQPSDRTLNSLLIYDPAESSQI